MHPGLGAARPSGSCVLTETRRIQPKGSKRGHHAAEIEDASLVVDVVPDPWGEYVEPAEGADDLAMCVDFEVVDERVVLEHHRQARIVAEERPPQVRPRPSDPPYCDAGGRLACHADLDIGRAVSRVDRLEALQEMVAQFFGHAFAPDHRLHSIGVPRHAVGLALVQKVLDEGWVSEDEVAIARSVESHRRQYLAYVGS